MKKLDQLNGFLNRCDMRIGTILKHRKFHYFIKVIEISYVGELTILTYIKVNSEGIPWVKQGTPTFQSEMKLLYETWKIWD